MPASMPSAAAWIVDDPASLFTLEQLDADLFQNPVSGFAPNNHLFGGQVLGQALLAATRTVPEGRAAHSLHAYFLRAGDASKRVSFRVDTLRDGRSFSARRVRATQRGAVILEMLASFHVEESGGLVHASALPPEAPDPETLMTLDAVVANGANGIARTIRDRLDGIRGIEVRPLQTPGAATQGSRRRFWVRMPALAKIDDPAIHQLFLVYLSDYWFAGGAVVPHEQRIGPNYPKMASIDHSLWFHAAGRADDWLLYDIESPHAGNMLGTVRGTLFDRAGRLLLGSAQQVLMRV